MGGSAGPYCKPRGGRFMAISDDNISVSLIEFVVIFKSVQSWSVTVHAWQLTDDLNAQKPI